MCIFRTSGFSPLFALAVVSAFPSLASAEPETPVVQVTASRFGGDLQIAAGVSLITADDIERAAVSNVPEALSRLGGIHGRTLSGDPNPSFDLRGLGASGGQNTLILLDGRRITENELSAARLTAIPLAAVSSIEILRGAGAVRYGGGATGGVINIVTRVPATSATRFSLGTARGSFDSHNLQAGFESTLHDIGLMVNAHRDISDNYRHNNAVREEGVEAMLRYAMTAGEVSMRLGHGRQTLGLPGARSEAQLVTDPRGTDTPRDRAHTRTWHIGFGLRQALEQVELQADIDWRLRQAQAEYLTWDFLTDTKARRLGFSPRVIFPHAGAGELTLGWDHQRWDYRQRNNFGGLTEASQDSDALYLQERLNLAAQWQLSAGWRGQRSLDARPDNHRRANLDAWELGLRGPVSPLLAVYGRTGKSFRLATVDENYGLAEPLLPQVSRDHEIGMESKARRLTWRLAAFESILHNEIHYLPFPAFGIPPYFGGANTNLSPTRRQGIEAEGRWQVNERLDLAAHLRLVRARFRSGNYAGVDVAGHEVPLVPRRIITVNAGWNFAQGRRLVGTWRHVGRQRYDNDQANVFRPMPAYGVLDLKYSQVMLGWEASLAVDNLLGRRYYSYGIANDPLAPTSFNAYPEAGRRLMLAARIRW